MSGRESAGDLVHQSNTTGEPTGRISTLKAVGDAIGALATKQGHRGPAASGKRGRRPRPAWDDNFTRPQRVPRESIRRGLARSRKEAAAATARPEVEIPVPGGFTRRSIGIQASLGEVSMAQCIIGTVENPTSASEQLQTGSPERTTNVKCRTVGTSPFDPGLVGYILAMDTQKCVDGFLPQLSNHKHQYSLDHGATTEPLTQPQQESVAASTPPHRLGPGRSTQEEVIVESPGSRGSYGSRAHPMPHKDTTYGMGLQGNKSLDVLQGKSVLSEVEEVEPGECGFLPVDVTLCHSKIELLEEHRCAFSRHIRLKEASLSGTGILQADLVELIADDIVDGLLGNCCRELEEVFIVLAEKLVKEV
ncbi:unnamed protein product [Discosporangium mesarthrocarpum]